MSAGNLQRLLQRMRQAEAALEAMDKTRLDDPAFREMIERYKAIAELAALYTLDRDSKGH